MLQKIIRQLFAHKTKVEPNLGANFDQNSGFCEAIDQKFATKDGP